MLKLGKSGTIPHYLSYRTGLGTQNYTNAADRIAVRY